MNVRATLTILSVGILLLLSPILANAQNAAAGQDATCKATCTQLTQQAYSTKPPQPQIQCVPQGGATIPCNYSGPGANVTGICQGGTYDCKAVASNGLNGGNSQTGDLSKLTGQIGQLIGQIAQAAAGGGGSGSSASSPTTATGCQSSYYYTSNTSLIGVDPCALYQPSTTCTDPNASNYQAQATCVYNTSLTSTTGTSSAQDLLNELNGSSGSSSGGSTSTSGASLSASPNTGASPLAVTFTTTPVSGSGTYTIDPGDGSGPQPAVSGSCSNVTNGSCVFGLTYTYTTAGTYTAVLSDDTGEQVATVSVSVTNPNGSSPSAGSLTDVFNTVGGLFTGTSTQGLNIGGQSFSNFPGVLGNILLDQNGATIFAQTVNSANNSETSGFYGSDTIGGQSQNVVAQLCQSTPWASNFLANIIPPSFFDSLCQWGGFQVGQTQAQTQPQVTLTQQTSTAPTQTTTQTQATTTPSIPAQAVIWAVPGSVPLGARTSVFWNTQGVTQCTETSPDGSFNESSLSGAAATLPLTQATTFTISCADATGALYSDSVTVSID